jgi:hypothetical protein
MSKGYETKRLLLLLTLTCARLLLFALLLVVARLGTGLVHLVEQGQASVLKVIGLLLDLGGGSRSLSSLALRDELAESGDLLLDLLSLGLIEAVLELLKGLLGVVDNAVSAVGRLDSVLAFLVRLGVTLGIINHGLNLAVGKTGSRGKCDRLILVGSLVLGVHVDNGVGIDVECDLNLGDTAVGRRDTDKLEVSKQLVVADKLTLTLVDLDFDGALEVGSGREDLRLLGGDGGVAVDQTSEHTAESLNTKRKRSDIEEKEVSDLTSKDCTLNRSTDGNSLIWVNRFGGVATEDALDRLSNLGHTGHSTDENDFLDILGLKVGILQSLANGVNSLRDKRVDELLELGPGHLRVDVLRSRSIGSDERKVDVGLEGRGELDLGLLGSLTNTLDSHAVTVEIDTLLFLELLDQVAHQDDIKVLATEMGITVGRLDLEHTALNLQNGDIESSTSKVVHGNDVVGRLVKTVGKSSSSGLIDNTEDIETGDLSSVLGGLTLGVVEVGRDSDNGILDVLAHVGFSGFLHLSENEASDLRWRILLALGLKPCIAVGVLDDLVRHLLDITLDLGVGELASDETLCGEECVLWVDNCLPLGSDTDEALALLGEADHGWGGSCT